MTLNLNDLPDVTFAEKDITQILSDMINEYEKAYYESSGEKKKLYPGDPIRIFLYTQALRELQLRVLIDDTAKQNLLKYARKESLENLGAFSRTHIFEPKSATAPVRFILSQARPTDVSIPVGTRVSPGNDIYFATMESATIPAGQSEVIINTQCTDPGEVGNDFASGQINILVDPLPWTASVENVEMSSGGADEEDIESYRERIHLAPEGFSVAGPSGAYEYFARQFSSLINDLQITQPSDGVVDIRVLLKDGEIPEASFIDDLEVYLSDKKRRPLTDKVQVSGPDQTTYDVDLTYYISSEDTSKEQLVKDRVNQAISDYIVWQKSKIGRDINPSELVFKIRNAGAKRVEVLSPSFTTVNNTSIATINLQNINYGGLEDE